MRIGTTLHRTILAGTLSVLASLGFASVVTDADGNRYHFTPDSAAVELTYLAADTANHTAYSGALRVPSSVVVGEQRLAVTGVTPLACVHCESLTSVSLPEGLTRIGFGAFSDCAGLERVELPSTLTTLSDWSFYRDASLQQIDVPTAVGRIGSCAFAFCTRLDSVSFQPTLRSIAPQSFYYCSSLRRVSIPASVMQLGEYAFAYTSLEEIRVEGSPLAITPDVFEGVDIAKCRLLIDGKYAADYQEAVVWREFVLIYDEPQNPEEGIEEVHADSSDLGFSWHLEGGCLHLSVYGDAPFFLYDTQGHKLRTVASHSGDTVIALEPGEGYILRCGRWSQVVML